MDCAPWGKHSKWRINMLTPEGYKKRLIERQFEEYMQTFGAICIEGPKYCGKTWTARSHSESAAFIGDPNLLDAVVDSGDSDANYKLKIKDEYIFIKTDKNLKKGDPISFSIRPERIRFTDKEKGDIKAFEYQSQGNAGVSYGIPCWMVMLSVEKWLQLRKFLTLCQRRMFGRGAL